MSQLSPKIKIVGEPIKNKKSNVRDVSCVAILSGRLTGVGGQSIAYVRKKQYLCRRIQRSTIKLFHNKCGCLKFSYSRCKHYIRFTSGALQGLNLNTRKRHVRSANEMRMVAYAKTRVTRSTAARLRYVLHYALSTATLAGYIGDPKLELET